MMTQQDYFIQFIRENKNNMYRFAYSILRNEMDAEDAVSEAIMKGYENIHRLRDRDKMKTWMMTILSNEAKKIYKKKSLFIKEEFLSTLEVENGKDYELWDVVKHMPSSFSEIIILYYYEGFSTKEIACILKIAEGTVKSRLSRARENLKKLLEIS